MATMITKTSMIMINREQITSKKIVGVSGGDGSSAWGEGMPEARGA